MKPYLSLLRSAPTGRNSIVEGNALLGARLERRLVNPGLRQPAAAFPRATCCGKPGKQAAPGESGSPAGAGPQSKVGQCRPSAIGSGIRSLRPLLAAVAAFGLCAASAAAIEIDFDQAAYTVDPGDTLALTVALNQAVPNGLDAYALRLSFPAGTLNLDEEDIVIVPELDHDLFAEGPAHRNVTGASATLRGFADFFEGPYGGTAFVTFQVSVPMNAPAGEHLLQISLADPGGNNFIDGAQNVIDEAIVFGTASLNIVVPVPEMVEPLSRNPLIGSVSASFLGIPGRDYRVQTSTNLRDWYALITVTADQSGSFTFTDMDAAEMPRRFYRVLPD